VEPFEVFKVLGVDTRVKILDLLKSRGPLGAKEIASVLGITVAAVSQHLKILKQAGLLRSERKGFWIPYSINVQALERCRQIVADVCTCGCTSSCGWRDKQLEEADLASLQQYQDELRRELQNVQCRIKEVRDKKRE
jgi:DNA-binding transcriptional ArsR family regulator